MHQRNFDQVSAIATAAGSGETLLFAPKLNTEKQQVIKCGLVRVSFSSLCNKYTI
jgi:hypothetical protein